MGTSTRTWVLLGLGLCAIACEGGPTAGGETHFLDVCEGECGAGLTCVCGVCTRECDADESCGELGGAATCVGANAYACESDMPRFCEQTCRADAECDAMGAGFRCTDGVCRMAGDVTAMAPKEKPLVMLLVDTSGSMERLADCPCVTAGCTECVPSCGERSERNRWANVVEALSGSWSDEEFRCEALARTAENGATYDRDYYLPYHKLPVDVPQAEDGVLDTFRTKVRFGLATLDGVSTYSGAPDLVEMSKFADSTSSDRDGLWSFGGVRPVLYPGCAATYAVNTGVRGPQAEEGALICGLGPGEMLEANDQIQQELLRVRPYGGAPIAAALDDLRGYLETVPLKLGRTLDPARDRVIVITDGSLDSDFRDLGCDCSQKDDPNAEGYCGSSTNNDPALMFCPYPLVTEAAEALRAFVQVDVLAFAMADEEAALLAPIAAVGSDRPLGRAKNGAELRQLLSERLEGLGH